MALVALPDLQDRLDFDLADNDGGRDLSTVAQGALDDLTADALFYGDSTWTEQTVPTVVKSKILRAAQRFMGNTDGLTQSRAGDETVMWGEDRSGEAGSAHFTDAEIEVIKQAARPAELDSFGSFGLYAWNSKPARQSCREDYVPVVGGGSDFPFGPDA